MVNPRFPSHWTDSLGACAERVAADLGISRQEQDAWALRSHERAHEAWEKGLHDDYVMAVDGRAPRRVDPRRHDAGAARGPAAGVQRGRYGHAGNSSPINDGAIAVLMGTTASAPSSGIEPIAEIVAERHVAVEPDRFSVAPCRRSHERSPERASDPTTSRSGRSTRPSRDGAEHAARHGRRGHPAARRRARQPARRRHRDRHPLGAPAPRTILDLCRELRRRGGGYGVAAACVGVGQGSAVVCRVTG
jgi:acetyl-CoA acyltransferase